MSDTETPTLKPSKCFIDWFGNQISVSSSSEEGWKEETFEVPLEDIDSEVCIKDSVYDT